MPDKRIPEDIARERLSDILDKLRDETIPRFIVGPDGGDRGVLLNADWYRVLAQQAEEHQWYVSQQPEFHLLKEQIAKLEERCKTYAGMLDEQKAEIAKNVCPRCRKTLTGDGRPALDMAKDAWHRLRGTLAEAAEGPPADPAFPEGGHPATGDVAVAGMGRRTRKRKPGNVATADLGGKP